MHEDPSESLYTSFLALKKWFIYILACSAIVGILAYGAAKNIPGTYESHFSYIISIEDNETDAEFRYNGYYALSAIELFSASLAGIANSPETIATVYEKADVRLPTRDATSLVRTLQSENVAPQVVRFTVRNASADSAEKLATSFIDVIGDTVDKYNASGTASIAFHGMFTEPWIARNTAAPLPIAASLFVLVFIGGIMAVLFQEAIKRGSS